MYTDLDSRFFKLARVVSFKSTDKVKIGAVLTKSRQVVGVGFNKMTHTHPLMARLSPFKNLHAELSAILGIHRVDLSGSVMFVWRAHLDGETLGMCKPCCCCQEILREVGVRRVYYTDPSEESKVGVLELT